MTYRTVSIGYRRDDGDFRILANFSNIDDEFRPAEFNDIVNDTARKLQVAASYVADLPPLDIHERQDTPDYVTLEDD